MVFEYFYDNSFDLIEPPEVLRNHWRPMENWRTFDIS
jgi:hypothetical protein